MDVDFSGQQRRADGDQRVGGSLGELDGQKIDFAKGKPGIGKGLACGIGFGANEPNQRRIGGLLNRQRRTEWSPDSRALSRA